MQWKYYQWGEKNRKNYKIDLKITSNDTMYTVHSFTTKSSPGIYNEIKQKKGLYHFQFRVRSDLDSSLIKVYNGRKYNFYFVNNKWETRRIPFYIPETLPEDWEINVQLKGKGKLYLKNLDISKRTLPKISKFFKNDFSKCLFFSYINLDYLLDNINKWTSMFSGFLFGYIMRNWDDNISKKKNSELFDLLKKVNSECKKRGVEDNYIKVAFYSELPELVDKDGWREFLLNFAQCAKFAKESNCKGIAIDTEYISDQYSRHYLPKELKQVENYGKQLAHTLNKHFHNISLIILPNGLFNYGIYWQRFFAGIISGLRESKNTSGIILFEEQTYDIYNIDIINNVRNSTYMDLKNLLSAKDFVYWKKFCNFAPGLWPLGYYRAIYNANNERIGYTGKYEKFHNQIVSSYSDKSERYPMEIFAGLVEKIIDNDYKYYWIYGHGAAWWQWDDEDLNKYRNSVHKLWNTKSQQFPTVDNIEKYYEILEQP